MAETQVTPWDQVNVDESISESDQAASDDLSNTTPVGLLLCTVVEVDAIEKTLKAYSCYAAKLKMKIDQVLKLEAPIFDDNGQLVKRNGENIMKVQKVPADKIDATNKTYAGRFVFDDVSLFHPLEKDTIKKRRLFVAKRLGIISKQSTNLPTSAWPGAVGKQVLVNTTWNVWEDETTKEIKRNVKVDFFNGYDYAENAGVPLSKGADTSFNTEEYDI